MTLNYYDILGVPPDAPLATIKAAYRRLAVKYHPDRNPHNPQAEAHFKYIAQAYQVLSDPTQRAMYDYSLQAPPPPPVRRPAPQRPAPAPTNWKQAFFWTLVVVVVCTVFVSGLFAYERHQARQEYQQSFVKLEQGDTLGAVKLLNLALFHDDDLWQAHWQLAQVQVQAYGDYRQAFGHLTAVLALHATAPDSVYALRGMAALKLEKYKTARQDFQEAVRLTPRLARHWLLLGIAHYQNQDLLEACRCWAKAGTQGDSLRASYCATPAEQTPQ